MPLTTINATAARAEYHVVASGTPAGLLGELHIQAVLGEEAFLHTDHQRRGLQNRHESEVDALCFQL